MDQHPDTAQRSSPKPELPMAQEGVNVTQLLIVRDIERSKKFYVDVLGAEPLIDGPPAILRFYNIWLILSTEGDATDDRPGIVARAPSNAAILTSALNFRVTDIHAVYEKWRKRGAQFLTPPKEHASEIRCYLRDPDGHLFEVGQAKESEMR